MKRTPLKRKTELARTSSLRRAPRKRKAKIPPKVRAEVKARSGGRCIVCRRKGRGQLHHVFDERLFPELAVVADNLVLICVECHERHTLAFRRIPRSKLPRCAIALAVGDWQRGDHLRRFYREA